MVDIGYLGEIVRRAVAGCGAAFSLGEIFLCLGICALCIVYVSLIESCGSGIAAYPLQASESGESLVKVAKHHVAIGCAVVVIFPGGKV